MTDLPLVSLQTHPSQHMFHDLGGQEWTELVQDVRDRGIQQPITFSRRTGQPVIVDGHQRVRAAKEAGLITIPAVQQAFEDERAETLALVMANIRRRHLKPDERRQVIAEMLRVYPEKSNRQHAKNLGVSHNTVKAEREELQALGQIDQVDRVTTSDGKSRPATQAPSRPAQPKPQPAPVSPEPGPTTPPPPVAPLTSLPEPAPPIPEPATAELEPVDPPKREREYWEVNPEAAFDPTPDPFTLRLQEIGYNEAEAFERVAVRVMKALTELNKYSAADLAAVAESKAGRGFSASYRLRRLQELVEEAARLLNPPEPAYKTIDQ